MKKYFVWMLFVCMFLLAGCGKSAGLEDSAKEEEERAAEKLTEQLTDQLISIGILNPDMQEDDGKILVWVDRKEVEIEGTECYALDLRYSEDEDINGEMAGRLIGSYAVSKDGTEFYRYNPADDTWEQILSEEAMQ